MAEPRYFELIGENLHEPGPVCTLLARLRKPSLRSLDLVDTSLTNQAAEILAASKLELDVLDVSNNPITDRGVYVLQRIAKLVICDR